MLVALSCFGWCVLWLVADGCNKKDSSSLVSRTWFASKTKHRSNLHDIRLGCAHPKLKWWELVSARNIWTLQQDVPMLTSDVCPTMQWWHWHSMRPSETEALVLCRIWGGSGPYITRSYAGFFQSCHTLRSQSCPFWFGSAYLMIHRVCQSHQAGCCFGLAIFGLGPAVQSSGPHAQVISGAVKLKQPSMVVTVYHDAHQP